MVRLRTPEFRGKIMWLVKNSKGAALVFMLLPYLLQAHTALEKTLH